MYQLFSISLDNQSRSGWVGIAARLRCFDASLIQAAVTLYVLRLSQPHFHSSISAASSYFVQYCVLILAAKHLQSSRAVLISLAASLLTPEYLRTASFRPALAQPPSITIHQSPLISHLRGYPLTHLSEPAHTIVNSRYRKSTRASEEAVTERSDGLLRLLETRTPSTLLCSHCHVHTRGG